jgi:anti-sigma factor RsiW
MKWFSNNRPPNSECRRIARWLPALPDGDLSPEQEAAVRAHLDGCQSCRREAEFMRALPGLLEQPFPGPGIPLPSGGFVVGRILEREAARAPEPLLPVGAAPSRPWSIAAGLVLATGIVAALLMTAPPHDRLAPIAAPAPVVSAEPAPLLVVSDDEWSGRRVTLLQPAPKPRRGDG